jgi:uncharacterized membrane protein
MVNINTLLAKYVRVSRGLTILLMVHVLVDARCSSLPLSPWPATMVLGAMLAARGLVLKLVLT